MDILKSFWKTVQRVGEDVGFLAPANEDAKQKAKKALADAAAGAAMKKLQGPDLTDDLLRTVARDQMTSLGIGRTRASTFNGKKRGGLLGGGY